jgi:hypothetical protein
MVRGMRVSSRKGGREGEEGEEERRRPVRREARPARMRRMDGWVKKRRRAEGSVVGTAKLAEGKRRAMSAGES